MKKTLIIVSAILLLALVTCPDSTKHQQVLKATLSEALDQKMTELCSNEDELSGLTSAFGGLVGKYAIDVAVNSSLVVDDYFVCSIGHFTWDSEEHVASVGCFGHVFTASSEAIIEHLTED